MLFSLKIYFSFFYCCTWFCSILSPEPRHSTGDRLQTDSVGISPSPGTPATALSLRKYHCDRHLSSLSRTALRDSPTSCISSDETASGCCSPVFTGNDGNVPVEGIFCSQRSQVVPVLAMTNICSYYIIDFQICQELFLKNNKEYGL